jgi:hypothetical protein
MSNKHGPAASQLSSAERAKALILRIFSPKINSKYALSRNLSHRFAARQNPRSLTNRLQPILS